MKRYALAFAIALLGATAAWGDIIKLKNGGSLEGVILQEKDGSVVIRLKYATVTVDRSEIASIEKAEAVPGQRPPRLARWDRCYQVVASRPWASELHSVPAHLINAGNLKNVPYMANESGRHVFNLYGDPERPANLELGLSGEARKSEAARKDLLEVMALLLVDPKDVETLKSLALSKDKKERDGLIFEIEEEKNARGEETWWLSAYDLKALDAARVSDKDLERMISTTKDDSNPAASTPSAPSPTTSTPSRPTTTTSSGQRPDSFGFSPGSSSGSTSTRRSYSGNDRYWQGGYGGYGGYGGSGGYYGPIRPNPPPQPPSQPPPRTASEGRR